jgi:hypothetical protein
MVVARLRLTILDQIKCHPREPVLRVWLSLDRSWTLIQDIFSIHYSYSYENNFECIVVEDVL